MEPPLPNRPAVTPIIRIVAALVNPLGMDRGNETVTLINTTSKPVNLDGWTIADQLKQTHRLSGSIASGDTRMVELPGDNMQLGNEGGTITLLNPQGIKVDGVAYTKRDVQQGQTIVFVDDRV